MGLEKHFVQIDLKFRLSFCHSNHPGGMVNECRSDGVFPAYGFSALSGVPPMRRTLPRRLQGSTLFQSGSVSRLDLVDFRKNRNFTAFYRDPSSAAGG